jgi:hypothetical protein
MRRLIGAVAVAGVLGTAGMHFAPTPAQAHPHPPQAGTAWNRAMKIAAPSLSTPTGTSWNSLPGAAH